MNSSRIKHGVLVQFAKAPNLGQVKTRMQPALTPEQALKLHCDLFIHTYDLLCRLPGLAFFVGASNIEHPYWSEAGISKESLWQQSNGDLGDRMGGCFSYYLNQQKRPWVIVIGSDCPFITPVYVREAIAALEAGERLVLGPATDGGYVLIGMRSALPVFENVNWGSERVLAQTGALARRLNIEPRLLDPVADIDRPEDLALLSEFATLSHWASFYR